MEWKRDQYWITDDPSKVSLPAVNALLAQTYWAASRPPERTVDSIQHSLPFSLFYGNEQIGFARVLTDYSVYAVILDVVIHPDHRRHGLGRFLVESMLAHPSIQKLRTVLWSGDQDQFYQACGFKYEQALKLFGISPKW